MGEGCSRIGYACKNVRETKVTQGAETCLCFYINSPNAIAMRDHASAGDLWRITISLVERRASAWLMPGAREEQFKALIAARDGSFEYLCDSTA
jgi:hypothetical protein